MPHNLITLFILGTVIEMFIRKMIERSLSRKPYLRVRFHNKWRTQLTCIVYRTDLKSSKLIIEIHDIRLFESDLDKNFRRIYRRLTRKYDEVLGRMDELIGVIGKEGVEYLNDMGLRVKLLKKNIDIIDEDGDVIFRGSPDDLLLFLVTKIDSLKNVRHFFSKVLQHIPDFESVEYIFKGEKLIIPPSVTGKGPDFSSVPQVLYKGLSKYAKIEVKMTGNRYHDFKLANKAAGLKKTPKGYTWHHVDDYDPKSNTCSMQLVKTEIHNSISHYGAASLWARLFEIIYK